MQSQGGLTGTRVGKKHCDSTTSAVNEVDVFYKIVFNRNMLM